MSEKPIEELSFEEAMSELEAVVRRLENGQVKLEEAVQAYERGVKLKNICTEKLQNAKSKIDLLTIEGDKPVGIESFDEQIRQ